MVCFHLCQGRECVQPGLMLEAVAGLDRRGHGPKRDARSAHEQAWHVNQVKVENVSSCEFARRSKGKPLSWTKNAKCSHGMHHRPRATTSRHAEMEGGPQTDSIRTPSSFCVLPALSCSLRFSRDAADTIVSTIDFESPGCSIRSQPCCCQLEGICNCHNICVHTSNVSHNWCRVIGACRACVINHTPQQFPHGTIPLLVCELQN